MSLRGCRGVAMLVRVGLGYDSLDGNFRKVHGMKKGIGAIAMLCLVVSLSFGLTGCGAGVDKTLYIGNWELVSASSDELDEATLQLMTELGLKATMTLNEDGTGTINVVDVKSDLTWEAKSDTEAKGTMDSADITYTLEDGKLTLHDESTVTLTFAREGSEEAQARQNVASTSSQSASASSASTDGQASSVASGAESSASAESAESAESQDESAPQ